MSFLENRSFASRLLILVGLMVAGVSIGSLIALLLIKPIFGVSITQNPGLLSFTSTDPATGPILKFVQLIQATFMFIVPANVYAVLTSDDAQESLGMRKSKGKHFVLGILFIFICVPAVASLSIFNERLALPDFLAGVENWMKNSESAAEKITLLFLQANNLMGLIINLFVIAVIPAIGEELIFRGVLQKLMIDKTKSIHIGIWITAIIFSAFHLQFYGFLPRLALGALLGYMYVWSGSLWVPILAHFINNGTAVILDYLYKNNLIGLDLNSEENFPVSSMLISFLLSFVLIYFWNKNKVSAEINGERLD